MAQNRFSLRWDAHKNNISDGLSSFQQNGDFVDMTLAAAGHYVKVHQVIMALASPYIKQIISELKCPHPVIFLNRVSYETLSSLLEYIYTGEVLIGLENLNDVVAAAKDLHIVGLENMSVKIIPDNLTTVEKKHINEDEREEICFVEMKAEEHNLHVNVNEGDEEEEFSYNQELTIEAMDESESTEGADPENEANQSWHDNKKFVPSTTVKSKDVNSKVKQNLKSNVTQYTISNQGSLQMILNRYIYYLKHINRDNTKQWRCVDYVNKLKCPAIVFTKDDLVTQRIYAHTHPFHDKRIFKKAQANAIFSAINDAVLSDKQKHTQNTSDDE